MVKSKNLKIGIDMRFRNGRSLIDWYWFKDKYEHQMGGYYIGFKSL